MVTEVRHMGDRANIAIKQDNDNEYVWLYSHWGGHGLPARLQDALRRGKDRWADGQYLARIIFQEMVGTDSGTTGYGISTRIGDNEYPVIVVDPNAQTVGVVPRDMAETGDNAQLKPTKTWLMANFINLALERDDSPKKLLTA